MNEKKSQGVNCIGKNMDEKKVTQTQITDISLSVYKIISKTLVIPSAL